MVLNFRVAGGGDCVIGFAPKNKFLAIKKNSKKCRSQMITIAANAQGVRIESFDLAQDKNKIEKSNGSSTV